MKSLPSHVKPYKSTSIFTNETIPKGLLKDHNTKNGVWGVIHVTKGKLEYTIKNSEAYILTSEKQGIVEPEILHHIRPLGVVSFFVEFYK